MIPEKFINGKLMFRNIQTEEWLESKSKYALAANAVYALSDEDRLDVFNLFCTHCGDANPCCQCWNDE